MKGNSEHDHPHSQQPKLKEIRDGVNTALNNACFDYFAILSTSISQASLKNCLLSLTKALQAVELRSAKEVHAICREKMHKVQDSDPSCTIKTGDVQEMLGSLHPMDDAD